MTQVLPGGIPGVATHSGWVEFGLAFGIPMLGLIFFCFIPNLFGDCSPPLSSANERIGFCSINYLFIPCRGGHYSAWH